MRKVIINYFLKVVPLKFLEELFRLVQNEIEIKRKLWITSHERPETCCVVNTWSDLLQKSPKFSIVIQGPIIKEKDFTLETIRIYKKHFEDTIIILSVWDDEDKSYLEIIRKEGIEIILNTKPEFNGIQNVNFQIVSSLEGIKKAHALGAQYCLKTRTDQRMYAPNVKEFLLNIIQTFPVVSGYKQKMRIVGVSLNTFKYRIYGLSDMNIFGHIDDMLLYWGVDLDTRNFSKEVLEKSDDSSRNFINLRANEVYLFAAFLEKIGKNLKWSLEDSWRVLCEHVIIVDSESLDMFWFKYARQKEYRYLSYDGIKNNQELNFREWLNMYVGLANKKQIPESAVDLRFNDTLEKML